MRREENLKTSRNSTSIKCFGQFLKIPKSVSDHYRPRFSRSYFIKDQKIKTKPRLFFFPDSRIFCQSTLLFRFLL